jgi:hypothetical protein
MNRILFNLIHFDREPNTGNVKLIINDLATELSAWAEVEVIQTYFQTPFSTNVKIRKIYMVEKQRALFRFKYLLRMYQSTSGNRKDIRFLLFVIKKAVWLFLQLYVFLPREIIQSKSRLAKKHQIEFLLSMKHFFGWMQLLNSDCQAMITFEDDVLIDSTESIKNVSELLKELGGFDSANHSDHGNAFDYLDLAGGISFEDMEIESNFLNGYAYNGITGNTLCCYFANRRLIERLVCDVFENPGILNLGSFLLLNSDLKPGAQQFNTFLPEFTPFKHGSLLGIVPRSIPYE